MSEQFTAEQFFAELDTLGEDKVRARLTTDVYGDGNKKRQLAQEWLRRKDQSREASLEAERIGIACKAADAAARAADAATRAATAAEEQSRFARTANTRATIALAIAIISAAVSNWDKIISVFGPSP